MIYATSDLHGYPLAAFKDFLDSAGFTQSDHLYIIGDVNDRNGDGGVAMYRWMMRKSNVTLIRGNHEQMLLDCSFIFTENVDLVHLNGFTPEQEKYLLRWNRNGCIVTIDNLMSLKEIDPEELKRVLQFLRATPFYQELMVNGKQFVLVHGGIPEFEPDKSMDQYRPLIPAPVTVDTRCF